MTPETYAALRADSGLTLKASDEQRVIETLRDDIAMWNDLARRYIAALVNSELRLETATRIADSFVSTIAQLRRDNERLAEELTSAREMLAESREDVARITRTPERTVAP